MLTRQSTPALTALLRSSQKLQQADLYTITLSGGGVIRWTAHDQAVTIDATTWASGPGISRDFMIFKAGVEAQTMNLTFTADSNTTVNGGPLLPFVLQGGFDGATVVLQKAFRQDLGGSPWVGAMEQFSGRVSDVESAGRGQVKVAVRSVLELFNLPLPPSVYQPQCLNTLYDSNCGIFKSPETWSAMTASATDGLRLTFGHTLPQAAGWFDLGAVQFVSGANAGIKRTVRQQTASQLTVMQPWPAPVAAGDAFQVYRGCDLTLATCRDKFNNLVHFRGQPFVPPPETVT